jgi:hypothetical protein
MFLFGSIDTLCGAEHICSRIHAFTRTVAIVSEEACVALLILQDAGTNCCNSEHFSSSTLQTHPKWTICEKYLCMQVAGPIIGGLVGDSAGPRAPAHLAAWGSIISTVSLILFLPGTASIILGCLPELCINPEVWCFFASPVSAAYSNRIVTCCYSWCSIIGDIMRQEYSSSYHSGLALRTFQISASHCD